MPENLIENLPGQTPLTLDDLAGLIPSHITLRRELNEFEMVNIARAASKYLLGSKFWSLTDPAVIKKIHYDMFCDTWKWAGSYRRRDTNIGCDWRQISIQVKDACADLGYWIENKSFDPVETAIRFHHRLIWIHPFPNGNGRHGRFMADIFLHQRGLKPLTWGGSDLMKVGPNRDVYIVAMKAADGGDYQPLLQFAQS